MTLLIGGAQDHNPSKASSTSNDQFMKIVDWIKSNYIQCKDIYNIMIY